jgi:hypothetical protein
VTHKLIFLLASLLVFCGFINGQSYQGELSGLANATLQGEAGARSTSFSTQLVAYSKYSISTDTSQSFHLALSLDLFGPVSTVVYPQYRRFSPQIEIALPGKSGLSIIVDAAYRRTETKFDTVWGGTEPGKASIFVETKTILAGLRKYLKVHPSGWPLGPYAELTAGYEHQYLDTAYSFLTDDPVVGNERFQDRFTMVFGMGYQGFFTERFLFSASMAADLRRIYERDLGIRVFILEIGIGFFFK